MAFENINIASSVGYSNYTWILAIVVILLSCLKWYLGRNDDYWRKRGVPYMPRPGFLPLLYNLLTKNLADLLKQMTVLPIGKVYGSFDGIIPNVVVGDPELLRDILVKDFNVFPYRRIMNTGDPIADSNVSMVVGEDWKRIRTTITPAFTSKRMRQMGSIIDECAKSVIEVCKKHCDESKPVDCKGMFGAFTMDVIAKSAFGTQINSHNNPQNEFVRKVRESFLSFTIPRFLFSILVPTWLLGLFPKSWNPMLLDKDNFFRDVIMKIIQKRKETGVKYNDFLQLLMDASEENTRLENPETVEDETDRFGSVSNSEGSFFKHKSISDTELIAQCVMFFMAGYESTATVLTFVAYCLAVNPDWQEKVIKEVDEGFQKYKKMSYDAVREMKILDAVVSETLRMHPPAASFERTAVEDYKLGNTGIVIEKGMRVAIPTIGMHYDPEYFQEPETFNPERFMDSYEPKHPQYAYLPFGAGPRNCLGMRFALLEIKMCISNVLHHFRLKPHSTTKVPLEYKKGMILLSVNDLPLSLERRTDVE